mmetsp:Transcript_18661/g.26575  ORF Transcript_18661/g.26575 Transcript_18661/m.26575 type:complete len:406 (+) Transcript_18661:131-1348(+)
MPTNISTYLTASALVLLASGTPATAFAPQPAKIAKKTSQHQKRSITCLHESKDNDRARMEKSWEHMMGTDWREFRAKLVAREQSDMVGGSKNSSAKQSSSKKEEKIGNFISGAISSIFSKGESSKEKERGDTTVSPTVVKEDLKNSSPSDIFDGVDVGGATKFSKIELNSPCDDPFMDEEECHIVYDEPQVQIDSHRWAHPLYHVEPGCILLANEKLGGVFHQTVVLIIDHDENNGSTGMVINRPFPGNLIKIASDTESNIDLSLKMAFSKAPVSYGGPVMQDQFSTLHGFGEVMGSKKVCPGVFVGGSSQLMQEVRRNHLHPTEVLFVKGHAAWVPGQLTREIEKGVWYIAAASADLILRYAGAPVSKDDNASDLWADVLSCMGEKYEDIATTHSGRGDERMLP